MILYGFEYSPFRKADNNHLAATTTDMMPIQDFCQCLSNLGEKNSLSYKDEERSNYLILDWRGLPPFSRLPNLPIGDCSPSTVIAGNVPQLGNFEIFWYWNLFHLRGGNFLKNENQEFLKIVKAGFEGKNWKDVNYHNPKW